MLKVNRNFCRVEWMTEYQRAARMLARRPWKLPLRLHHEWNISISWKGEMFYDKTIWWWYCNIVWNCVSFFTTARRIKRFALISVDDSPGIRNILILGVTSLPFSFSLSLSLICIGEFTSGNLLYAQNPWAHSGKKFQSFCTLKVQ